MKIKELFSSHHKWTRGSSAKTNLGVHCTVYGGAATRFCLLGAIQKCYGNALDDFEITRKVFSAVAELGFQGIAEFNDSVKFADVKKLVEKLDI